MREMTLLYVHNTAIGYARLGVKLAAALERMGITIYDHHGSVPDLAEQQAAAAPTGGDRAPEHPTSAVCWVTVPTHVKGWWQGQHPTLFTMYETVMLPQGFHETMGNLERIFVPSQQNVDLFSTYHDDVRYVPLGVDPTEWHYVPRPNPAPFFRFLIAGSGLRKGTDLAFKAFETVFGDRWDTLNPMPMLVMKNPRREQFEAPWVEMHSGRLTDEQEQSLYATCHAYVQPSRGEGFGLQPLQALAQGMPTILTNAHGHAAFADLGIPISAGLSPSGEFIYGPSGEWWEPDFEELCEAMWDVYQRYSWHQSRAMGNAMVVTDRFCWDRSAQAFWDNIKDLTEDRVDESLWVENKQRLYLTILNRDWNASIGGYVYHFKRGVRYHETADVKRVLYEAGMLDPACLTGEGVEVGSPEDRGLTEAQAARLGDYSARHSFCRTCGQRLNTQPTHSDELLAKA